MNKEDILKDLENSVTTYDVKLAKSSAQAALDANVDPVIAINEGLVVGMGIISDRYAEHKIYLPQVLVAATCMYAGLDILIPAIPVENMQNSKKCATAVVEGDVHDIGKNIVKTMLTAGGYIVSDLGKDVSPNTIVEIAEKEGIGCVCLSTLMTPTLDNMKRTLDLMNETGYRSKCIVTIGGPPTSPDFAAGIGADHKDTDAQNCVGWLKEAWS
jgi:methanogenic corrinoid protein MtbC1